LIGGLVEYYNPAPGERYGVIREIDEEGKYSIATGWYGLTTSGGHLRRSSPGTFQVLTPKQIALDRKQIEKHFKGVWDTSNSRRASVKKLIIKENNDEKMHEINYLPPVVAAQLEEYFLSHRWFAHAE